MSTMAEDNARDMKALRNARVLHEGLTQYLRSEAHIRGDIRALLTEAALKLEKEAEHIEAVWN